MQDIYTVNDLLNAAADALYRHDIEALENLISVVRDWMQPQDELQAQLNMLNAMIDAADRLEETS